MVRDKVMLRCASCRAINKLPVARLSEEPKCGKCKRLLTFPSAPVQGNAVILENEVYEWPGIVLLEFFAHWCGHCRTFNPTLEGFAREMAGIIKIVQIDVDKDPHLAQRFNIKATPSIILFDNGKQLDMVSGALTREQLEALIDSFLK